MTAINKEERYSRQADLVPADRLAEVKISVIGTGAIGRQVALQLTAMGAPNIKLIDFDTVETGNLAAQGFYENDLGKPKVDAVKDICQSINKDVKIEAINDRYRNGMDLGDVVFCCVDKIDIRSLIWNSIDHEKVKLFIDGRMSAEALRILIASDPISNKYYPTTLFAASEAFVGSCTAKTTIYSSNVIAGIMVAQLAKYLRNMIMDCDIQFNLLSDELDAIDGREAINKMSASQETCDIEACEC